MHKECFIFQQKNGYILHNLTYSLRTILIFSIKYILEAKEANTFQEQICPTSKLSISVYTYQYKEKQHLTAVGISHLSKTSWEKLENLHLRKNMLIKEIINWVSVAFKELSGQIGGNWF